MDERAELLAEIERTLAPRVVEFARIHARRDTPQSLTDLRAIRRALAEIVDRRHPKPQFEWELDGD